MSIKMTSTKPYIVKAFYDWISDNELTPYIVVDVNIYGVLVPMAFVNDGQIVLNVSASAVGHISLGDKTIEFSARFGGKLEHLSVPYGAISAIYAKENGAGTSLELEQESEETLASTSSKPEKPSLTSVESSTTNNDETTKSTKPSKPKGKPSLKVIK